MEHRILQYVSEALRGDYLPDRKLLSRSSRRNLYARQLTIRKASGAPFFILPDLQNNRRRLLLEHRCVFDNFDSGMRPPKMEPQWQLFPRYRINKSQCAFGQSLWVRFTLCRLQHLARRRPSNANQYDTQSPTPASGNVTASKIR